MMIRQKNHAPNIRASCAAHKTKHDKNDKRIVAEALYNSSEKVDGLLRIAFPFSPSSIKFSSISLSGRMSLYDVFT